MRKTFFASLLVVTAVTLTACQTQPAQKKPTVTANPPTVSVSDTPTPQPTVTVTATPTSSPTSSSVAAPSSPGCVPDELTITLSRGNGAAGTNYYDFILLNSGTAKCSLRGYPTVQVVTGSTGKQVGKNAAHSYWTYQGSATDNPYIVLKPGNKAYVQLAVPSIYNYATGKIGSTAYTTKYNSKCGTAVKATGYRMYLPGENVAAFIKVTGGFPVCSENKDPFIRVSEIVPKPTSD